MRVRLTDGCSLTFSPSEELLACSSDKGTVHVFEIADKTQFGRSMYVFSSDIYQLSSLFTRPNGNHPTFCEWSRGRMLGIGFRPVFFLNTSGRPWCFFAILVITSGLMRCCGIITVLMLCYSGGIGLELMLCSSGSIGPELMLCSSGGTGPELMYFSSSIGPELMLCSSGSIVSELVLHSSGGTGPELTLSSSGGMGPELMLHSSGGTGPELILGSSGGIGLEIKHSVNAKIRYQNRRA